MSRPQPRQGSHRTADRSAYAIDDETAVKVADGVVEIVSEGHWRHF